MLIEFIINYWPDILVGLALFFAVTFRLLPPTWAGLEKEWYDANKGKFVPNSRQSLTEAVTTFLFYTVLKSPMVAVGLRGAITIIMFAVISVELYNQKTISTNAVIIAMVGTLGLYFEQMLKTAQEFTFWKVFSYKAKK